MHVKGQKFSLSTLGWGLQIQKGKKLGHFPRLLTHRIDPKWLILPSS
jgi:hypothetical protein